MPEPLSRASALFDLSQIEATTMPISLDSSQLRKWPQDSYKSKLTSSDQISGSRAIVPQSTKASRNGTLRAAVCHVVLVLCGLLRPGRRSANATREHRQQRIECAI